MTMMGTSYAVLISLTIFAMAGTPANDELDKTEILKFVLEQFKMAVLTWHMKQSTQVMKEVLEYTSELDMQHQRSLKRVVCMVYDLNNQMTNITKSYYNEKSKVKFLVPQVKDLNSTLNVTQRRVQQLEQQNKQLSERVESLQRYINFTRQCEKRQHLQKIRKVVQRYVNDSDWSIVKRDLGALLDHDSEEYTQLRNADSMFYVGNKGYTQLASLLLCAGLPVDKTYGPGYTILHYAAAWEHLELVQLLLDHGADVNVRDHDGWTPLINAAWNGNLEVVKWLALVGADITPRNNNGKTALDMARSLGHRTVARYLESLTHQDSVK